MNKRVTAGSSGAPPRVPCPNQKYKDVKAVVETGMTAELARYIKQKCHTTQRRAGEPFLRVPSKVLGEYLLQIEQAKNTQPLMDDGGFAHPMDEYRPPDSAPALDYLLFDCRSEEDYEACHIKGALHYSKRRLAHATNPFLPEMFAAKNKSNKLIVLYDMDGEITLGQNVALVLFEKGIDNVAVLDGGLREFVQDYASLIVGECPVPILPRDTRLHKRAEVVSTALRESNRTFFTHKPKSLSNSLAKPKRR